MISYSTHWTEGARGDARDMIPWLRQEFARQLAGALWLHLLGDAGSARVWLGHACLTYDPHFRPRAERSLMGPGGKFERHYPDPPVVLWREGDFPPPPAGRP